MLSGPLEWGFGVEANLSAIGELSTQNIGQASGTLWPASQEGAHDALGPDLFQGLDASASADVFPELPLVVPDSRAYATDLAPPAITELIDNPVQTATGDVALTGQKYDLSSGEDNTEFLTRTNDGLPQDSLLLDLLHVFFHQHHIFLPFLHKSRYLSTITSLDRSSLDRESAALLFAVIALAAASHDDPYVRARQPQWFTRAKSLCEDLKEKKYPSLRGVQASLCICVLAWTTGNYHLSWLYIGTSWRQAVTLGLNRIDGEQHKVGKNSESKSELDIEERRRTIWTLFVLDRGMAFPAGWPHAIDDRQFMVNLPLPDSVFQASDDQVSMSSPHKH